MKLARIFEEIIGNRRGATPDDIRKVFGDYHNLLRWLTGFLIGDEKLADACMVDACTIAETQTPDFHEWLVHWGSEPRLDARSKGSMRRSRRLPPNMKRVNQPI